MLCSNITSECLSVASVVALLPVAIVFNSQCKVNRLLHCPTASRRNTLSKLRRGKSFKRLIVEWSIKMEFVLRVVTISTI